MPTTHGPPCRPATGFTLIELAIALTIMVVLGAAALPSFGALIERHRLKAAIGDLQADLAFARQRAAQWRRPLHLNFQPGADWCYVLATDPQADCRLAVVDDRHVLKVARAADHAGIALLAADDVTLQPDAPAMPPRRILMATASGLRLVLQSSPLGRFGACQPAAGSAATSGVTACADDAAR